MNESNVSPESRSIGKAFVLVAMQGEKESVRARCAAGLRFTCAEVAEIATL